MADRGQRTRRDSGNAFLLMKKGTAVLSEEVGGRRPYIYMPLWVPRPCGSTAVVYAVQEVSKTASKGAQNGSHCPGNEGCAVESWLGDCIRLFVQLQACGV